MALKFDDPDPFVVLPRRGVDGIQQQVEGGYGRGLKRPCTRLSEHAILLTGAALVTSRRRISHNSFRQRLSLGNIAHQLGANMPYIQRQVGVFLHPQPIPRLPEGTANLFPTTPAKRYRFKEYLAGLHTTENVAGRVGLQRRMGNPSARDGFLARLDCG